MIGSYAELNDVYDLGLSPQAFVIRPRTLDPHAGDVLDYAAGIFRLTAHGFTANDLVEFVLVGTGTVPGGGAVNTTLYPEPIDFYRFKLSLTAGGAPLTFTSAGVGAWGLLVNPERKLARHLVDAASRINENLTAYATPLLVDPITGKFPTQIVGINARMAARSAAPTLMVENAAYRVAMDRLFALEAKDDLMLADWKSGKPVNPKATDQDNIPDDAARAASRAPVPWQRRTL